MTDTKEIEWSLVFRLYRAIVNRGRFYFVIHIERRPNDEHFVIVCIHCKKDRKDGEARPPVVFTVTAGHYRAKTFPRRKDALDFAISIADLELNELLRKVA